jgi:hypothetical protein
MAGCLRANRAADLARRQSRGTFRPDLLPDFFNKIDPKQTIISEALR